METSWVDSTLFLLIQYAFDIRNCQ